MPNKSAPFWYQLLSQNDREEVFDQSRFENELNQILEHESCKDGQLSRLTLSRANRLGDRLSQHYLEKNLLEPAKTVLTALLNIGDQTRVDVTKLLTRLARVHIADDNICDAIAILFLVFSDLPSVYDESGPDEEPLIFK